MCGHDCVSPVELRESDEVLFGNLLHGRHRAPVELVEVAGRLSSEFEGEVEPVSLAPRIRTEQEPTLAGEPHRKSPCAQNVRVLERGLTPFREAHGTVADHAQEGLREAGRVEALADRALVASFVLDDRRAE
jgi:hypothetical protein